MQQLFSFIIFRRFFKQKMLQNLWEEVQCSVKVIGYFSTKILEHVHIDIKDEADILQQIITHSFQKNNKKYAFKPIKMATLNNSIAFIDSRNQLWAILQMFNQPICLSDMLRLKVYKLILHHSQIIFYTREGWLLLSWGNKKILKQQKLTKQNIKNQKFKYLHFFQLFAINNSRKNDFYYYSFNQKINTQSQLYQIKDRHTIVTYPNQKKTTLKTKIMGISIGKYHNLCWDQFGKLFSWGCKSIALGYSYLPEEEIVLQPTEISIQGHVVKAYADNNYSMALTLEGKIYQWGINKLNPKNEEIIFTPREIMITPINKFVDLKGKNQRYAILSLSGQLYVWGKDVRPLFGNINSIHITGQSQNSILHPVPINKDYQFIIDYEISDSFIALITSSKHLPEVSHCQRRYWNNLKEKIKENLSCKTKILKTEGSEEKQLISKPSLVSLKTMNCQKIRDPIQLSLYKRRSKQDYFNAVSDPTRVINYIMQPNTHKQTIKNSISQDLQKQYEKVSLSSGRKVANCRLKTSIQQFNVGFKQQVDHINFLVNKIAVPKLKIAKLERYTSHSTRTGIKNIPYQTRRELVLKKKIENESQVFQENIRKIQKRSFQYRMVLQKKHEEVKQRGKEGYIYKNTLQKYLIKHYIIKLLSKPISSGRQAKIENFALHLKCQRLEKNIRGIFIKNRVKIRLKKLQATQMTRFFLLIMSFQQYVKAFRCRKLRQSRKIVVSELFKSVVKEKIKVGISACIFNIRKLQKFRQWLVMVKVERKKCIKYCWKIYLLSMMKINSDHESSATVYLPKNVQDLSFQTIYQEKVVMNPLLKLSNFLNKHSIFKIKATYFQKLITLFSYEKKKVKSSKIINSLNKQKKTRIKFLQDEQQRVDRLNLIQTDILPYSLHYNILIHPKNYDITIPEIMKLNDKWIKEEKKIFQRQIQLIITQHELSYMKKRKCYDLELAHYIRKNYHTLSEKRWKYIILYNKLERTFDKIKKQREIRRLMQLISAQKLLDEDCIPQKQSILDEVIHQTDAPIPPNSNIILTSQQFKKLFKSYYEVVLNKAKQTRRSFF